MSRNHEAIKNDPKWKAACKRVKRRDAYQCQACGSEEDLTVDHVNAMANGGAAIPPDDELVTLCRSCNSRKGTKKDPRLPWFDPAWL